MKIPVMKPLAAIIIAAITAWAASEIDPGIRLIAGAVIAAAGFILLLVSRKQLGEFFTVMPAAKGLMTEGIYSKIRDPLYFFLDVTLAGVILITGIWWLVFIWGVLVMLHVIQSAREEKVLREAFGRKYDEYKKGTWF